MAVADIAVVFGIFNELNDGHRSMLREARMLTFTGDVVVVVATDRAARRHNQGKSDRSTAPLQPLDQRIRALLQIHPRVHAIAGDDEDGKYTALHTLIKAGYQHNMIICLGYNQNLTHGSLGADLRLRMERRLLPRLPIRDIHPYFCTLHATVAAAAAVDPIVA